jgi:hypothetical protein
VRRDVEQPYGRAAASSRRDKRQRLAIRRDRRLIVVRSVVGQALEPAAVGADTIDVGGAIPLGREEYELAVRGKSGGVVQSRRRQQRPLARAVGSRDEEAGLHRSEAAEQNPVAWRGCGGCPQCRQEREQDQPGFHRTPFAHERT